MIGPAKYCAIAKVFETTHQAGPSRTTVIFNLSLVPSSESDAGR